MSVAVRSNPRPAPSSANDDIVLNARMSMAPTNADRLGGPPRFTRAESPPECVLPYRFGTGASSGARPSRCDCSVAGRSGVAPGTGDLAPRDMKYTRAMIAMSAKTPTTVVIVEVSVLDPVG